MLVAAEGCTSETESSGARAQSAPPALACLSNVAASLWPRVPASRSRVNAAELAGMSTGTASVCQKTRLSLAVGHLEVNFPSLSFALHFSLAVCGRGGFHHGHPGPVPTASSRLPTQRDHGCDLLPRLLYHRPLHGDPGEAEAGRNSGDAIKWTWG